MKNLLLVFVLFLSGCGTENYKHYADTQARIAISNSEIQARVTIAAAEAAAARYNALSKLAESGTESSKIAAVMAIALNQNGDTGSAKVQQPAVNAIQPPQNSEAIQWASILVPSLTQVLGISANMRVATTQSDNAAAVAISTNNAFVGMANKIQAPAANITTTTSNTLSGSGVLGSGSYATTANPSTVTTNSITGTGVLGSGTYNANQTTTTSTDSHATTTTDSHATSTTSSTTDDHTTNPTTVTPAGKVCSIDATGVLTCL